MKELPSHTALQLPLVEILDSMGGGKPKDVCAALAEKLNVPKEVRDAKVTYSCQDGPKSYNLWERRVRWVRQSLVAKRYIPKDQRGHWDLTEEGKDHLKNCKPGVVVTLYETDSGLVLWAEAQSSLRCTAKNSIQLIFTSPEYPLNKPKDYGNRNANDWLQWFPRLCADWKELMTPDGSLVVNLGEVWDAEQPTQNIYIERFVVAMVDQMGFDLNQRFAWENPCKMPASHWMTVRRVRVNASLEPILWFGKKGSPSFADNRQVLLPYSEKMVKLIAAGGEAARKRPSGHGGTQGAFGRDNGGVIPHSLLTRSLTNLLTATNAASNDTYMQYCRENGLPIHPARYPSSLPEFFLRLTTRPGDIGADFMSGSLNFAEAAERTGRRYLCADKSLSYLRGGRARIEQAPGFRSHEEKLLPNDPNLQPSLL